MGMGLRKVLGKSITKSALDGKRYLAATGLGLLTGPAYGHAADQGFVLLLPTTAYTTAGTLAVVFSIVLLSVLRPGQVTRLFTPLATGVGGAAPAPRLAVQVAASAVLAGLIYIGLEGPTDPQANLLPLMLWTLWWMALFVIQGLVFDVWSVVNPWIGLHRLVLPGHNGWLRLPAGLSIWPAAVIFLAFQGFVLADPAPNDPTRLASFALGYWVFTFAGMSLFGPRAWLRQVECFTVLFHLLGLLRPVKWHGGLKIGFPGWQLFDGARFDASHAVFILIVLGAGSFDGLYETFWWLAQLGVNPLEFPGRSAMVYSTTIGLLAGILALILVYAVAIWLGVVAVSAKGREGALSLAEAFVRFSVTLLPIAFGYHFAHYFVTFLVQSQVTSAALGDPLARGWSLLGLGSVQVKVGFLAMPATVRLIWLAQAGIVVLSHIQAVFLSHRTAEALCKSRADVVKVQLGLSILMVIYTVFGLWLLASPRGA